jgi:hypothetical protein
MSHNIIQIHDLTLLYGIFFIFSLNVEIFHKILSVPRNIVMDLNNVMTLLDIVKYNPVHWGEALIKIESDEGLM